jgi:hypothetical protein
MKIFDKGSPSENGVSSVLNFTILFSSKSNPYLPNVFALSNAEKQSKF